MWCFCVIELDFFIIYFFFHIVKKIVLKKNLIIKLYEVTKNKRCGENQYSPIAPWIIIVILNVLLFFLFNFFMIFSQIYFCILLLFILPFYQVNMV